MASVDIKYCRRLVHGLFEGRWTAEEIREEARKMVSMQGFLFHPTLHAPDSGPRDGTGREEANTAALPGHSPAGAE